MLPEDKKRATYRAWYEKNREQRKAYARAYRATHPKDRARENEMQRRRRAANPEQVRAQRREGMRRVRAANPELYRAHGRRANGLPPATRPAPSACELCNRPFGNKTPRLDHSHQTGKFRAWLCHNCNTGLGHFRDDPDLLKKAAALVDDHFIQEQAA